MKIIIARHGEAETTSPDGTDRSRSLTSKGKADVLKMADFFKIGFKITKIYHSPYERTTNTAKIYTDILHPERETESLDHLKAGQDMAQVCPIIREYSNSDTILLVGHSPDVSVFAEKLLGISGVGKSFLFSPGSALAINVPREKFHDGQIIWFVCPDFLG
ncbi:phosphohistidine phosphatase SixA [Leptospira borgpetersenii serovar Hardjo-bovis]|uniref:phosphohistidine phosphatase SixA n=1 Tax=Leptospira borgpetersenii TaxID=174 RepID=UPI0000E578B6|nr:phosphohistidine phosphatase SixA [Leptospira borgpetersenii]ABJ79789.1 Phosphohistidine phosphatase [Leptospira borgpetersenii serovar Hardjo-bovis str. L550]AMX59186.1 phosphohistidine phosphatase [Leptospira borgpetersenii serovar Hardjo]AMX62415.1 phosphohistidine phosphatase [Leptospira borgpetersenii serovar Hardjo]AMX65657.1 phosphohistidine phosphatase [Leptospira borgpetersenii serovar Hardjo]AMX68890.1 phosphohistidine phosphatase [Leptospira borgpetersenii serovar Hardjo]